MIPTLFFIFLAVTVLGFIAAIVNMACAVKNFGNSGMDGMKSTVIIHFIAGFFYVIGGLGATITGIMWLVMFLKAA